LIQSTQNKKSPFVLDRIVLAPTSHHKEDEEDNRENKDDRHDDDNDDSPDGEAAAIGVVSTVTEVRGNGRTLARVDLLDVGVAIVVGA